MTGSIVCFSLINGRHSALGWQRTAMNPEFACTVVLRSAKLVMSDGVGVVDAVAAPGKQR